MRTPSGSEGEYGVFTSLICRIGTSVVGLLSFLSLTCGEKELMMAGQFVLLSLESFVVVPPSLEMLALGQVILALFELQVKPHAHVVDSFFHNRIASLFSIHLYLSLWKVIEIAPVLPTEEPNNSLSRGDKHLSTILETESDEVIKSSVENLVPIPNESEVASDDLLDTLYVLYLTSTRLRYPTDVALRIRDEDINEVVFDGGKN
nr:hypothetical protein [Tanacetum cinerariifolium]